MHFHHQRCLLAVALATYPLFSCCASPVDLDLDDICTAGQSCGIDLLQRRSTKVVSQEAARQVGKQAISAATEDRQVGDEDVSSVLNHSFSVADILENVRGLEGRVHDLPKRVNPFFGHGPIINSTPRHAKVAAYGQPPFARTLANWGMTNTSTGIHLYIPPRKHRLAVSDAHGRYVFAGDFTRWTFHSRVHMSEARTGKMLVEITRRNDELHETWEIGQWFPICPSQAKYETTRRGDVYPYARLTKKMTLFSSENATYDVDLYNCDGSFTHYWRIQDEMRPGTEDVVKHVLAVYEPANDSAIGILTQPAIEESNNGVNCYVAGGEDAALFAAVSIILHKRMDDYIKNDAQFTMWIVAAFCILGPIFALVVRHVATQYL